MVHRHWEVGGKQEVQLQGLPLKGLMLISDHILELQGQKHSIGGQVEEACRDQ